MGMFPICSLFVLCPFAVNNGGTKVEPPRGSRLVVMFYAFIFGDNIKTLGSYIETTLKSNIVKKERDITVILLTNRTV